MCSCLCLPASRCLRCEGLFFSRAIDSWSPSKDSLKRRVEPKELRVLPARRFSPQQPTQCHLASFSVPSKPRLAPRTSPGHPAMLRRWNPNSCAVAVGSGAATKPRNLFMWPVCSSLRQAPHPHQYARFRTGQMSRPQCLSSFWASLCCPEPLWITWRPQKAMKCGVCGI